MTCKYESPSPLVWKASNRKCKSIWDLFICLFVYFFVITIECTRDASVMLHVYHDLWDVVCIVRRVLSETEDTKTWKTV